MQNKLLNPLSNTVAALRGSLWCHLSMGGQVFGKKQLAISIDRRDLILLQVSVPNAC